MRNAGRTQDGSRSWDKSSRIWKHSSVDGVTQSRVCPWGLVGEVGDKSLCSCELKKLSSPEEIGQHQVSFRISSQGMSFLANDVLFIYSSLAFIEGLLCTRHCSRCWEKRQFPALLEFPLQWSGKLGNKQKKTNTKYSMGMCYYGLPKCT